MRVDIPIRGFAPDLDVSTLGIILNSNQLIPTINGVKPLNFAVSVGLPALSSDCRGAASIRLIDDTLRLFAGTQTKLYEAGTAIWNDVSKGGGTYTGGAENRWRFAQYGQDTIATNRTDPVQVSNASGAFSDLGGSPPKASIVETCQGFVLLFDYNDGVNDYGDGWWCSALRNDASWTPSIATQAANGRLLDSPGKIAAAKSLGDVMVAYKQRSMYLGTYQGPPVIWAWTLLPGEVGCVSQDAVQSITINGTIAHIFAGFDGFYMFDGTRPVPIMPDLRKWYNNTVPANFRYKIKSLHDRINQVVIFYLPDSAGSLTYAVAYHYVSGRVTYLTTNAVEATVDYLSSGITYDGLGTYYTTYDNLPTNIAFDSPFWTSVAAIPSIFRTGHLLYSYSGTPVQSEIDFGYTGDSAMFTTLTRIRPKCTSYPTADKEGNCYTYVNHTQNLLDTNITISGPYILSDSKYDMLLSDKWFAPIFIFQGTYELTGYSLFFEEDGEE